MQCAPRRGQGRPRLPAALGARQRGADHAPRHRDGSRGHRQPARGEHPCRAPRRAGGSLPWSLLGPGERGLAARARRHRGRRGARDGRQRGALDAGGGPRRGVAGGDRIAAPRSASGRARRAHLRAPAICSHAAPAVAHRAGRGRRGGERGPPSGRLWLPQAHPRAVSPAQGVCPRLGRRRPRVVLPASRGRGRRGGGRPRRGPRGRFGRPRGAGDHPEWGHVRGAHPGRAHGHARDAPGRRGLPCGLGAARGLGGARTRARRHERDRHSRHSRRGPALRRDGCGRLLLPRRPRGRRDPGLRHPPGGRVPGGPPAVPRAAPLDPRAAPGRRRGHPGPAGPGRGGARPRARPRGPQRAAQVPQRQPRRRGLHGACGRRALCGERRPRRARDAARRRDGRARVRPRPAPVHGARAAGHLREHGRGARTVVVGGPARRVGRGAL
mmetsp:Transcript_15792/g.53166  ORF Transcript_15792/g.53166 Transcript_15792/m.53166 type:complete len:441 (+) Transcript_15792:167-1489(+)